jgi:lysozyme
MKTSTEGLISLIAHEGIVQTRYKDSVGVWTIGVGHTKAAGGIDPANFTGKLTIPEVIEMLRTDIVKYENGVNRAVKVPLKQHEFDALVSFHYNTGAIGRASFVKKLNAGDRAGAARGMMDWKKPSEIIPRRTAERDLFLHGKYSGPMATIYPATAQGKVLWGRGERVNVRSLLDLAPVVVDAPAPEPAPVATAPKPAQGGVWAAIANLIIRMFGGKP